MPLKLIFFSSIDMTMVCDILIDLELSIFKCSEKNIYIVEILIKIKDFTIFSDNF